MSVSENCKVNRIRLKLWTTAKTDRLKYFVYLNAFYVQSVSQSVNKRSMRVCACMYVCMYSMYVCTSVQLSMCN